MKVKNNNVKIGGRIPHRLYFMFKYVCMTQRITMESKIEELLMKDVKATAKKPWFLEHLAELEKSEPEVFAMLNTIFTAGNSSELGGEKEGGK